MPARKSKVGAIAPDTLREIGLAMGGSYWQADVAVATGTSKSQITRFLNGGRVSDYSFSQKLKGRMIQRIESIAGQFTQAPLPEHDSPKTARAQKLIAEALELLKDGDAILSDWKPQPPKGRGGGRYAYGPKKAKTKKKAKS